MEDTIKEFSGKILGYYKKSSGATTDFSGRILAYGNILSALIWQDAGH